MLRYEEVLGPSGNPSFSAGGKKSNQAIVPMLPNSPDQLLTIQEAASKLKVSIETLRRWDARGFLVPIRTPGNQRRYTLGQIQTFQQRLKKNLQPSSAGQPTLTTEPKETLFRSVVKEMQPVYASSEVGYLRQGSQSNSQVVPSSSSEKGMLEYDQNISNTKQVEQKNSFFSRARANNSSIKGVSRSRVSRVGVLSIGAVLVVILLGVFSLLPLGRLPLFQSFQKSPAISGGNLSGQVLAADSDLTDFALSVNLPALFTKRVNLKKGLEVTGGVATLSGGLVTNNQNGDFGTGIVIASNIPTIFLDSVVQGAGLSVNNADPRNPTISNTGVLSLQGQTGALSLSAGSGISISGLTISSTSSSSSTNSFANIAVSGQNTLSAGSATDTLTFVAGSNVTLTTDTGNKSLTINASGAGSQWTTNGTSIYYNAGNVGIGTSTPLHVLELGSSTTEAGGIGFGSDLAIYRGAADRLDVASGDRINLVSGSLEIGGTTILTATSLVQAADGNAGSPSHAFALDTTTGMFSPGTGLLAFATGGTERVRVGTDGNVGIGTTLPSQALDVSGNILASGTIEATGNFIANGTSGITFASPSCVVAVGGIVTGMGSCSGGGGGSSNWNVINGALSPIYPSADVLVGGSSTASAKFAFMNVAAGTPTASISGNITLNSAGNIQTTKAQPLTIGGSSTGQVVLSGRNGSSTGVTLSGYGAGVLQPDAGGVLSSSALNVGGGASYITGTLPVGNGGTGATSFTTNGILFGNNTGAIQVTSAAANSVLVTNGSNVPSLSTTLPTAVQDNITRLGTITQGVWNGTVIGSAYGGTGQDFSSTTGVPYITSGTFATEAQLAISRGGTNANTIGSAGSVAYSTGTAYGFSTVGGAGQVLVSGGSGAPTWADASNVGINYWTLDNGTLYPNNSTVDLLIGGTSTASAKFAFINVTSGTPTASIAGNIVLSGGSRSVQTKGGNTLTLGGNTTGQVVLSGRNSNATGITLSGYGVGVLQPDANGILSSAALNLAGGSSYITGQLPIANGGTNSTAVPNAGAVAYGTGTAYAFTSVGGSGQILTSNGSGAPTWVSPGGTVNFWQRSLGTLAPLNSTDDLLIGGTATSSALVKFSGTSGGANFINTGGNVGIGTTNPSSFLLEVAGNIGPDQDGTRDIGSPSNVYHAIYVNNIFPAGSGTQGYWQRTGNAISPTNSTDDVLVGGLATSSALIRLAGTAGTNSFFNSGNVGIGTDAPGAKLHVVGDEIRFTGNNGNIAIQLLDGGSSDQGTINLRSGGTTNTVITADATLPTYFNAGNVGIGTVSPVAKLDVAGDASVSGNITLAGGARSIQATENNTLTLGGNTTGTIAFSNLAIFNAGATFTSGQNLTLAGITGNNAVLYATSGSGIVTSATTNSTGQCLISGASAPAWGSCTGGGAGGSNWSIVNGVLTPDNSTLDLTIGGQSSASAKFAILNVNSGTPVASVAGNIVLSGGARSIQATGNNSLTIGGNTTGQLILSGRNGGATGVTLAGYTEGVLQPDANGILTSAALNLAGGSDYVIGILPIANGGTNTATLGSAGSLAYSNGTSYAFSSVGNSGQCLTSGGTGTPVWADCGAASGDDWDLSSGALYPKNSTVDLLIGGTSTASAKFAFINNNSGTPTASIAGNIVLAGVNRTIQTTDNNTLTLGGSTTGNIDFSDLALFTAGATVSSGQNLTLAGLTTNGGVLYTNGTGVVAQSTAGTAGQCLMSNGSGAPTWINCATGINYWDQANGALYPINSTLDLLVGGQSSASAKFAVLNMNSGTPVASLSATTTGLALSASGGIQSLRNGNLTLGGSTTGAIQFAPNNTTTMTLANGNVGIGTTSPGARLHVAQTLTDTSGFLSMGLNQLTTSPGGTSTASTISLWNRNLTGSGTTQDIAEIYGIYNEVVHQGQSGSDLGLAVANNSNLKLSNTGTIALGYGNYVNTQVSAAGTITQATGLFVNQPSLSNGGAVTTMIGAQIASLSNASNNLHLVLGDTVPSGNYGIYNSSTYNNYFAGNVGIGTTAPIGLLNLSGAATGKALAILNQTGNQDILSASTAGVTKLTISNSGNVTAGGYFAGLTGTTTTLQAAGVTTGEAGSANIKFTDSLGVTRGRIDTTSSAEDLVITSGTTTVNQTANTPTGALSAGAMTITLNSAAGFAVNDSILIYQTKSATSANNGIYDYRYITKVEGNVITLNTSLTNSYTQTNANGACTSAAAECSQVIKIDRYASLQMSGGTLTAPTFDAASGEGGVFWIDVIGTANITGGTVTMAGNGLNGGTGGSGAATQGTTFTAGNSGSSGSAGNGVLSGGAGSNSASNAGGAGSGTTIGGGGAGAGGGGGGGGASQSTGGTAASSSNGAAGGNGGNGSNGGAATGNTGGSGGTAPGGTVANRIAMGGGGGGGAGGDGGGSSNTSGGAGGAGGAGGSGGGIIVLHAGALSASGATISAAGASGDTGTIGSAGGNSTTIPCGGGGAGGSGGGGGGAGVVWLNAPSITNSVTPTVAGGSGGAGGNGGAGGSCTGTSGDAGGGGAGTTGGAAGTAGAGGGVATAGGNAATVAGGSGASGLTETSTSTALPMLIPNYGTLAIGGATIGTYASTINPPSGGLIVSGNVGIGTASPSAKLSVVGGNNINEKYPDGLVATPVHTSFNTSGYTVPAGKTLYITRLVGGGSQSVTVDGILLTVLTSGTERNFSTPILVAGGSELDTGLGTVQLHGFLVDTGVTPLHTTVTTSAYTVPAGKTLFISRLIGTSSQSITVNGATLVALSTDEEQEFDPPIMVAAGTDVDTSLSTNPMHGYLTDGDGTGGADLAESYFIVNGGEPGDVVSVSEESSYDNPAVEKSKVARDQKVMGIIATNPGIVLKNSSNNDANPQLSVALAGRVPVKVISEKGGIANGDGITSSALSGFGMKASQPGTIVAKALEPFTPSAAACPAVASVDAITWPSDPKGINEGRPCFTLPDGTHVGKIMGFVNTSWYDPDVYLTSTGNISILDDLPYGSATSASEAVGQLAEPLGAWNTKYALQKDGEVVNRVGLFSDVLTASLSAGIVDAKEIRVNGVNILSLINNLGGQPASPSSSVLADGILRSTQDDIAGLKAKIASLEEANSQIASETAFLRDLLAWGGSNVLGASSSAGLGVGGGETQISGDLTVLGRTRVQDLGITGSLTAGVLSIDGLGGEINTIGEPLKIQSFAAADVDFMDGKVLIKPNGNIISKGEVTAKKINIDESDEDTKSLGEATIAAGERRVEVETSALTEKSKIFVTSEEAVAVGAKKVGDIKFRIELKESQPEDLKVNWWIVN